MKIVLCLSIGWKSKFKNMIMMENQLLYLNKIKIKFLILGSLQILDHWIVVQVGAVDMTYICMYVIWNPIK